MLVRRRHPLARRRQLALKDMGGVHWVFPSAQTAMWRHIEALFAAENLSWPTNYVTTSSVLALRSLIMGSDSVTISLPHLMELELETGQLAGIPLRKPPPRREIVIRRRKDQPVSPLAERFLAALRPEAGILRRRA